MTNFPDPEHIENDVLHSLADFRDVRALEIGGGDGRMIRHYLRETAFAVALDPDREELLASRSDYLRDLQTKAHLVEGRAEALPFPNQSFDLVVLGWSL